MRVLGTILFLSLLGCGGKHTPPPQDPPKTPIVQTPTTEPEQPDGPATKAGPSGVPLPADADDGAPVPGGGDKITVFKVPRGKLVVADEVRASLAATGWIIVTEGTSPRGAIRIEIKKDVTSMMLRMTGDDEQTALIVQAL